MGTMDEASLRALMTEVANGEVAPDQAVHRLRRLPFADLGFRPDRPPIATCARAFPRPSTDRARPPPTVGR